MTETTSDIYAYIDYLRSPEREMKKEIGDSYDLEDQYHSSNLPSLDSL